MSKILLVEDSAVQVLAIRNNLTETAASCDVAVASTGIVALEMVQELLPDIVILDVGLPDISGLEVCRKIKNSLSLRHITVIIHSVENRLPVFSSAFEAGADYYIPKGNDSFKNLNSLLQSVLRRRNEAESNVTLHLPSIQLMRAS
jgi:CheY-like chemotaxis protein